VADTTTPKTAAGEESDLLPNAVNGMELRMVPLDAILIPENRHKRRGRRRKDQLGGSMQTIGLDSPVLLSPAGDGKFWLVAGGGRLENAREKGWAEIHAIVKVRDAKAQAASTAAENIAREGLSPAEEADAIEVMIKAGDSPREAAEKVGLTPQTGTLRMPLVELPEEIRGAFHFDGLPPSLAADVKMLYDGNHEIGLEIGALGLKDPKALTTVLSRGVSEFFRQLPRLHQNAKLSGKPPFIASFHRGSDHGRSLSWHPEDPRRIKINGEAAEWFIARSNKARYDHERPGIVLSEEDLDTAVAIGVAYHSEGEHGMVWVHDPKWLTDQINEFVLARMQAEAEAQAKETPLAKLKKAANGKVDPADMTVGELVPTLERKFTRELQPKAYRANLDLGVALTSKLAVKALTREHALFFAHEVLGRETEPGDFVRSYDRGARRIAECAARVMADWITLETKTLKSGKTKTTVIYLEGEAAEKRMWDHLKAGKTPEEILQRALHIYAAAAFFKRECGADGKTPYCHLPANATARQALTAITKPIIPMSVKRIDRQVREYDAIKQAEQMIEAAKQEAKSEDIAAPAPGTPEAAQAA
jgi:ParB/RepB/Spo0J family partition protein